MKQLFKVKFVKTYDYGKAQYTVFLTTCFVVVNSFREVEDRILQYFRDRGELGEGDGIVIKQAEHLADGVISE